MKKEGGDGYISRNVRLMHSCDSFYIFLCTCTTSSLQPSSWPFHISSVCEWGSSGLWLIQSEASLFWVPVLLAILAAAFCWRPFSLSFLDIPRLHSGRYIIIIF